MFLVYAPGWALSACLITLKLLRRSYVMMGNEIDAFCLLRAQRRNERKLILLRSLDHILEDWKIALLAAPRPKTEMAFASFFFSLQFDRVKFEAPIDQIEASFFALFVALKIHPRSCLTPRRMNSWTENESNCSLFVSES